MHKFFLSFLLTGLVYPAFSQIKEKDIIGKWRLREESNNATIWILERDNGNQEKTHFGTFVEFKEDKSYYQYASAPCGNDDNRYSFQGKWELNPNNEVVLQINLKTSGRRPNMYNNYTLLKDGKMKIISAQKNTLQLQVVKNWEKVSPKSTNH